MFALTTEEARSRLGEIFPTEAKRIEEAVNLYSAAPMGNRQSDTEMERKREAEQEDLFLCKICLDNRSNCVLLGEGYTPSFSSLPFPFLTQMAQNVGTLEYVWFAQRASAIVLFAGEEFPVQWRSFSPKPFALCIRMFGESHCAQRYPSTKCFSEPDNQLIYYLFII